MIFSSKSAETNMRDNTTLLPFVTMDKMLPGFRGDTPHGYNHGPSEIHIDCEHYQSNMQIRFKSGEVRGGMEIYLTPDGDTLAVRNNAGSARSIGFLHFYKKKDFGFEVGEDFDLE